MATTGGINRGPTGRLRRNSAGELKKCGCACGEDCETVIMAVPCYQVLDANCNRQLPSTRWICTDATCDDVPIGSEFKIIDLGDYCVRTVPGTEMAFSKLDPEDQDAVIHGPLTCVPLGCDDEACQPEEAEICPCVCSAGDPDDGDYCCLGKKTCPSPGNCDVPSWDWTVSGTEVVEMTRTKKRGGPSGCPLNISRSCNNNDACTVFRREYSYTDDANTRSECCLEKAIRSRIVLNKGCGALDTCGLIVNPWACDCPNVADGIWNDNWGSQNYPVNTPDGRYELCTPVNTGSSSTEFILSGGSDFDGCHSEIKRTINEEYTCDNRVLEVIDEEWTYWFDNCDDGAGAFPCCLCQIYYKTTIRIEWVYHRPNASDVECDQCEQELVD